MILSRRIAVSDRVFTIPDLLRISHILDRERSHAPDKRAFTKYEVIFEESLAIEGSAAEVFNEEVLTRPSRPFAIEMRFHCPQPDRAPRVDLFTGDIPRRNNVWLSGEGEDWVNATYSTLDQALNKTAPQSFWWRNHPTLLLNVIALGLANIMNCILKTIAESTFRHWPSLISTIPSFHPGSFLWVYGNIINTIGVWWVSLFWCWLGLLPAAGFIRRWILSMWPSIEFNFGSPHLRLDNRRQKFYWVMGSLVVPLIVSTLFEILKASFQ